MITDDQRHALEQIQAAPTRFHNLSDAGNALRFADQHGHRLRFNAASGKWLIWSFSFWSEDRDGEVMRLAKATARSIFTEAAAEEDEATRKKLAGHAVKTEAKSRLDVIPKDVVPVIRVNLGCWRCRPTSSKEAPGWKYTLTLV